LFRDGRDFPAITVFGRFCSQRVAALVASAQKARAQPIGISAAPNTTGQARGRGKEWPARHDKS
jgi:hypothetical protein